MCPALMPKNTDGRVGGLPVIRSAICSCRFEFLLIQNPGKLEVFELLQSSSPLPPADRLPPRIGDLNRSFTQAKTRDRRVTDAWKR